ncbi:13967_t:CDS:2 [Funneliformis geosporum]|nr:13967_t:CDS:2 [Funneliformis geosporum]
MSRNHEYFERKPEGWSIVDFLNRCDSELFDAKLDRYIKSLKTIVDEQGQGERAEKAKCLLEEFKKASKNSFKRGVNESLLGDLLGYLMPKAGPDRKKANEWEKKRSQRQVNIHQPNLNAGTLINGINRGIFKCIYSETKLLSKKSDDDDDFQSVPVRQQKRKKNLSIPKAETTKNTPSSLPKAVPGVSPGSGKFIFNDQRLQTSDPSYLSLKKTINSQEEVNEKINDYVKVEESAGDQFVEWIEDHKPTSKICRSWILRNGTNVGEILARNVETIPEAQKCLNEFIELSKANEF